MKRQKVAPRSRESQAGVTAKAVSKGFVHGLGAVAFLTAHTIPNRKRAQYDRDGLEADWRRVGTTLENVLKKARAEAS